MPTTTEQIAEQLRSIITGEVSTLQADRATFSHDTSIFEITPSLIVYPKNKEDVSEVVRLIHKRKSEGEDISITGRSAGTDMTGGPLTSSIVMGFTKYMNHIGKIEGDHAITEPGVFYRNFEKETLKQGLILPSYPASRELCAMGGIINNNSGGERTLAYGKTERYVEELSVVLSDGSPVTFRKLSMEELAQKEAQQDLEGAIYRETHALIEKNYEMIMAAKPKVTKNSAGYALWNVYDKEQGTFDLTKLIVGAQGTLGMVTEAKLKLVRPKEHRAMLIMFLTDLDDLPEIVHRVLARKPESFESYDDKTFALAKHVKEYGTSKDVHAGIFIPPRTMDRHDWRDPETHSDGRICRRDPRGGCRKSGRRNESTCRPPHSHKDRTHRSRRSKILDCASRKF